MSTKTENLKQPDTFFWNRERRANFLAAVQLGLFKTTAQVDGYLKEHPLDEQREQILKENTLCKP